MDESKKALKSVQVATIRELSELLDVAMEAAHITIANQSLAAIEPSKSLFEQKSAIIERFAKGMHRHFDSLTVSQETRLNVLDYANLSLVAEDDLEAMIAMEGMVSHSRNSDIREYLRFSTRLDTMLYGVTVDESNNPLDPEQIGEAFKEAIRPVELRSKELLIAYRSFNQRVFHKLESVLEIANTILIDHGVLPNLDLAARQRKARQGKRAVRVERSLPEQRAFSGADQEGAAVSSPQLFSMIQSLMHGSGPQSLSPSQPTQIQQNPQVYTAGPVGAGQEVGMMPVQSGTQQSMMMVGGKRIEMLEQNKLFDLLQELQTSLVSRPVTDGVTKGDDSPYSSLIDVNKSLGELLNDKSDDEQVQAIDSRSADVISLITMLYEVIWQDETVPIPVKELIGRTQIAVLTIALQDASFFDSTAHPARQLLNELATAGISWTEFDKLEHDPVYSKMQEVVGALIGSESLTNADIEDLLDDFKHFKSAQLEAELATEKRLADVDERQQRIEEIENYGRQKILERILDSAIPDEIVEFLETKFHKFVTQVLLREGPGGVSWKPVMNTIDVLLWTVQSGRSDGDVERFVKVNPRLMTNLGKALAVAGYDEDVVEETLNALKRVQKNSFDGLIAERKAESDANTEYGSKNLVIPQAPSDLPEDDEHLIEVGKYNIGIWLEFKTQGDRTVRCTLAAKIATIDKYVFINSQGVKVIEKTKMGLAKELKAGTVRVISEAPLLERAMETVIGKLRSGDAGLQTDDSQKETA